MHHKTLETKTTTTTDQGQFVALAATYSVDRVNDRIVPGAFEKTIQAWQTSQKRIPLHWDHSASAEDIVGWVDPASMRETNQGLEVAGQLDLENSEVARQAWRSMKNNAVSLSFGYLPTKQRKAKDGVNELLELDVFEISVVPAPANPDTRFLSLKNVREAQVAAVKDALSNKAIVRDPDACSIEEPWAVMDGDEVVSCHANQEDAREGMEKRMSSIAEEAARSVKVEPEPADEKTLRRATFDMALAEATAGIPKSAVAVTVEDSPPASTEETIRAVVKEELAQVVEQAKAHEKPPTIVVQGEQVSEEPVSEVEDGRDEEPSEVKSAPQDPLRRRTGDVSLDIASDGLSGRKYTEPTPEPEPEPLDERELRRRWDEARLEIASG